MTKAVRNVIFIPAWEESSENYIKRISKLTFNRSARWKNINAVSDAKNAKYAVCLGSYRSILKAKALGMETSQIIYIKRESIESLPEIDGQHFAIAHLAPGALNAGIHWIDLELNEILTMKYRKDKKISTIVSSLEATLTHRKRLWFINEMTKRIDIDVYGEGHAVGSFNGKYKGELKTQNSCKEKG